MGGAFPPFFVLYFFGSIHVTVDETGQILSAQDYYPYGGIVNGRSFDNSDNLNKFKFTEKERDTETNLDYFGARYYNSDLGLWLQVDPLAEKPALSLPKGTPALAPTTTPWATR